MARDEKTRGVWERVPGSGVWWIIYYDAERKRRREKIGRKSDAIAAYTQRKAAAIAGKKIERPIRERELTFKEFAENALAYSGEHKASGNDDPTKIAILVTEFGDRPASSLTQQELAKFLDSRGRSPATFNRYRATLSMIYREAIRMGWTERNPARLIGAKKENNARIRFLSDDEENRLRNVIKTMTQPEQYLNEIEIALHTGMRKSEQFSLDWNQVDLKERRLNLLKTKNGEMRMIPLNSTAVAAFERQKLISGRSPKVFITGAGKPFGPDALRHWFDDAIDEAEVEDFTWHCLRHTFCSRLIQAGVSLKVAQELMGHKTIAMTARYAHLAPGHLQSAVEMIAGIQPPTTTTKTATSHQ